MRGSLTVTVQPKDMEACLAFLLRRRWLWRKAFLIALRSGAAFCVVLVALNAATGNNPLPLNGFSIFSSAALGLAVGCMTSGIMFAWMDVQIPHIVQGKIEDEPSLILLTRYSFDDARLIVSNMAAKRELVWSDILAWSELEDYVLLIEITGTNFIIPKHQVPVDTLQELIAVLRDASVKSF